MLPLTLPVLASGVAALASLNPEQLRQQAQHMREQARRCVRLARSISNPEVIEALEALGREFEAKAAELDAAAKRESESDA